MCSKNKCCPINPRDTKDGQDNGIGPSLQYRLSIVPSVVLLIPGTKRMDRTMGLALFAVQIVNCPQRCPINPRDKKDGQDNGIGPSLQYRLSNVPSVILYIPGTKRTDRTMGLGPLCSTDCQMSQVLSY